jgi:S-DNA-T family DNA segregation ATPase FtsK/SpoIIIE
MRISFTALTGRGPRDVVIDLDSEVTVDSVARSLSGALDAGDGHGGPAAGAPPASGEPGANPGPPKPGPPARSAARTRGR